MKWRQRTANRRPLQEWYARRYGWDLDVVAVSAKRYGFRALRFDNAGKLHVHRRRGFLTLERAQSRAQIFADGNP